MWKRLIIIFIAFMFVSVAILHFTEQAKSSFTKKLYQEYVQSTNKQIEKLKETLQNNADEPTTYYYISLSYWHINKVDLAMQYIKEGIEKFPTAETLQLMLGKYYVGLGEIEKAEFMQTKLIKNGYENAAKELQETIDNPALVPLRGEKNIFR
jgi:tetratricopeptide (TPR) repeat protein